MKQIALRMPDELAERIDDARGMVPRERYLRGIIEQHLITSERAVEAALGRPDESPKAQPPRGSGSPGTTAPAPPRASDDVRRREPDPRMFKTAGDHRRAMARFNARGEW